MDITQQVQSLLNGATDSWKEQLSKRDEQIETLRSNFFKNQNAIDELIQSGSARTLSANKSFGNAWNQKTNEVWNSRKSEIDSFRNDKDAKISFEIKVADMTMGGHLTGDGVASYGQRQGLVPSHAVNIRDLIPTTSSPTGIYATYRETGTSGSISVQTEAQDKTQIDYSFTEIKTVSDYIAGYATFSKQMMYHLPFIQNALTRMLLRDFYKKENAQYYTAAYSAATGTDTTPTVAAGGPANDAEELLFWIGNQRNASFNASFALISWTDWTHLLKTGRNSNSAYGLPGGVIFDNVGNMQVAGVPIIAVPWVTTGECLIVDRDYIERVETESLRVEFSYENGTNFVKNLITARVECFADLNLLRTDALISGEFGGS